MPVESSHPPLDIPNVDLWNFLFDTTGRDFGGDQEIFVDSQTARSYTHAQIRDTAADFGKAIQSLWGWKKGDVIALYTPNCIDTPAVVWGTHLVGGVISPANPAYTADEVAFQLKDSKAKALVTQADHLSVALEAARKASIPENRICLIGDERDAIGRFKHFTAIGDDIQGTSQYRRVVIEPDKDLAFLIYSSGTTGHPKGVMLSHRNLVSNTLMTTAGESELSSRDRILSFLPFFHIYGLTCVMHHAMYRGIKCVVMTKFSIEDWCSTVQQYAITFAYVVPPVVLLLAKHPCVVNYNLGSIRMMTSGAAPLTRELVRAVHDRTKLRVKQGYGLSETSPATHLQSWPDWHRSIGSVGSLLPNQTAMIVSLEEIELSNGKVGELWIKGPNVFKGYLNNPAGTRNSLSEHGYFKTGDIGYFDGTGNFYITDRIKELIKYKGFQVAPAELEGLLASHNKINDVAVIGFYRKDLASEVPLAYVVPERGVRASPELEKEIVDWLASKVASHKRLRGGVKFIDEVPKSASGKILRRHLKDKLEAEMATSVRVKL